MTQMAAPAVVNIPSKWDIIPIHNSDRAAFKNCRRRWDWSSPARQNLTVRADIYGVSMPLWFGTGIHYALEQMYQPKEELRRDPVEAFTEWYDVQWNGGEVTPEWLTRTYDTKPVEVPVEVPSHPLYGTTIYKVRGLKDILPDSDPAEFELHKELGINMLNYYKDYAARNDGFEVYAVEHDFSIPIWDYANGQILLARDMREDSPNHGRMLEVHARGRMDAQWVNPAGKRGIHDYKTAARWDEELTKLENDEQCTSYLYAAQVEANYYDLPWKAEKPDSVIYSVLRKTFPKPPTELKNGTFSVDRQNESTTYEMLQEWIARHMPGVPLNEKQEGYLAYLRDVGDEQFVIRRPVKRNQQQIASAGYRLYLEALDMLDPNVRIYPNIRNDWSCLNCSFRAPCLAMEDGGDYQQMLQDTFTSSRDR